MHIFLLLVLSITRKEKSVQYRRPERAVALPGKSSTEKVVHYRMMQHCETFEVLQSF